MLGAGIIEHIHDELIAQMWPASERTQRDDRRDRGMIESAVGRPFHSAFGEDAYPSVLEKAAVLFHSLVSNHPFQDGNKRTAVMALDMFLVANGHICLLGMAALYKLAERTASYRERGVSHAAALREIHDALETHVIPLTELRKSAEWLYKDMMRSRAVLRRNRMNKLILSG